MSKYLRLDGTPTDAEDPKRGIWYSAGQHCGYWTDDWSKLSRHTPGIPCCPHCGCVGMQTTARDWLAVPDLFLDTHPRYDEWLPQSKEQCGRASGISFMDAYRKWYAETQSSSNSGCGDSK